MKRLRKEFTKHTRFAKKAWIWLTLAFLGITPHLAASNVSLGTIEQPINLVAHSDPASIPLGAVIYEANYNYGIHTLISAPRPCLYGAMEWSSGSELNQNLASVFGILVEPEDSTSVPYEPVNIRIKAWDKPDYSPYTKEQVLAATLHCLLRSVHTTPKHPLKINIIAEDPRELSWAKKYEKEYAQFQDPDGPPITATPIPNTRLTTSRQGVTSVHFTNIKTRTPSTDPRLTLIASRMGGADGEDNSCALIPVWTGTTWKKPLAIMGLRCGLYYDLFSPQVSLAEDSNLMVSQPGHFTLSTYVEENETSLTYTIGDVSESDLAASIYAAVISIQPSKEAPLQVKIHQMNNGFDQLPSFVADKAWKKVNQSIECTFILDPKSNTLAQGSIPLVKKLKHSPDRSIRISTGPAEE